MPVLTPAMATQSEIISLPSGGTVVLVLASVLKDTSSDEYYRNIFRLDGDHKVVWRVHGDFDTERSGRYTKLWFDGFSLTSSRWDGGRYQINIETGRSEPAWLERL